MVLQDVHTPHNISACLRSAEAFGVSHCDVVQLRTSRFSPSSVARGGELWLQMGKFLSVDACAQALHAEGYKIAVAVPVQDAVPLYELPVEAPIAVIFGNEHAGADPAWLPHVDYRFTIPMQGMVESLNISVSAGIVLSALTHRMQCKLPPETYFISPEAQQDLLNQWVTRQVPTWALEYERYNQVKK